MVYGSDGYTYLASIYCGKSDRSENLNLGCFFLLAEMQTGAVFDNLFTSYSLLVNRKIKF